MSDVLVLRNPRSGRMLGRDREPLPGRQLLLTDELDVEACIEAQALVIEGGDGTLQRVLTTLLRAVEPWQLPPIAVMPAGTTNVTAANLNQAKSYEKARDALEIALAVSKPAITERSVLRVQFASEVHFGFLFGLGIVSESVAEFLSRRSSSQLVTAWHMSAIFARSLLTTRSMVQVETESGMVDTFAMMATTLDRVLYGMRPYLPGDLPGRMHTIWIEAGAGGLWRRLPRLARGAPSLFDEKGFTSRDVISMAIRFDGSYTLDGELYHSQGSPLVLSLTPPLRFLVL